MLPDWDLDESFDRLAAYGIEAVELRVRDNPPGDAAPSFWGRHVADVSPANVLDKVPAIRAAAARTGVRVCTLAPRLWPDKPEVVDAVLAGAHAIDPAAPPMVRLSPPSYNPASPYREQFAAVRRGIEELLPRTQELGIKLLYEIHVGTVAMSAGRAHALLDGLDPDAVGAIFDVPNMSRVALEDTRQSLDLLGPYLAYCHIGGSRPIAGAARRARSTAVELGVLRPGGGRRQHPAGGGRPACGRLRRLPHHRGLQRPRYRPQAARRNCLPAPSPGFDPLIPVIMHKSLNFCAL